MVRLPAPLLVGCLAVLITILSAPPVGAQIFESVGTRAQGMAGAFVAVADDATATWWNPAGLATGSYFSLIFEKGETTEPAEPPEAGPAWRSGASGFALAVPSMGLSFYTLRLSEVSPSRPPSGSPTADDKVIRQDQGSVSVDLRTLTARELGLTVGQSVGSGLVIGSNLKLVTRGLGFGIGVPGGSLDTADDLDASSETKGDLDIGVMVSTPRVRIGVTVKHLWEPEFGDGDDRFELQRQARAGVAVFGGDRSGPQHFTLAFDTDLTKTRTVIGEAQHVAGGAEASLFRNRFGVRAGLSHNIAEPSGTSVGTGLSIAFRGLSVDGAYTWGRDKSRAGWNISVRTTIY